MWKYSGLHDILSTVRGRKVFATRKVDPRHRDQNDKADKLIPVPIR
jgi:hypothetical protein